jgi:hypothetical protein
MSVESHDDALDHALAKLLPDGKSYCPLPPVGTWALATPRTPGEHLAALLRAEQRRKRVAGGKCAQVSTFPD